jgi:hypothetical protein
MKWKLASSIAAVVLASGAGVLPGAASQEMGVRLSISARTDVTVGEPVVVDYSVANRSGADVRFNFGWNREGAFAMTLRDPRGISTRAVPSSPPLGGISRTPGVVVETGKTYSQRIIVDKWLKFTTVGTYILDIAYGGTASSASGPPPQVDRRWRFEVDMRPRDGSALLARCEELAGRAKRTLSVQEQLDAVAELSYVNDQVAVPFLEDIAGYNFDRAAAIGGIERIALTGDAEARRALARLAANRGLRYCRPGEGSATKD